MKNHLERIGRHVLRGIWTGTRDFPPAVLRHIEHEISANSTRHEGNIHFVVEGALHGEPLLHNQSPRARALDIFSHFRLWDTPERNGILIYVLLADRTVDIVVDRGLHQRMDGAPCEEICHRMEAAFREGRFEQGAINGIRALSELLVQHFPALKGRTETETGRALAI
ncbi:MAG TPA: TPM domain-containing protein [Burkholderiaceae bacterium]